MNLAGKKVMITGASQGIGAACVEVFRRAGAELSLCALPDPAFDSMAGKGIVITQGDITDPDVQEQFVRSTLDSFGAIDVLVNNAGVGLYGYPTEVSTQLARRMFDVNVFAPLEVAQRVVRHMKERRQGCIVNVGSVGDSVSLPWAVMYCSSKFALKAITDSLRRELNGTGIRVMRVAPGIVATEFRKHVLGGGAPTRVEDIRRVISPAQVAEAILAGVRRNARTVYVPQIGRLFVALELLAEPIMDMYLRSKI